MIAQRPLGRTGLQVSALGFGGGAVGGLMVRGDARDQERAVARALELGITYFDTAPSYGDGASETNLGRVLRRLRPELVLGTKFHVEPDAPVADSIAASLEASLRRLGREQVDLLQLHNPIAPARPRHGAAGARHRRRAAGAGSPAGAGQVPLRRLHRRRRHRSPAARHCERRVRRRRRSPTTC